MQVTQLSDLDTHVVIGGGEAKSFRIAETPEFYTVLSSTLYRDKMLAVVREIICNAWDAHIVAGKTDLPIDITVDENEFVVRDYGPGIPHEKVGDVYCVYGGTTKVADENQNGGFGLGSKAPFAYNDHFTVSSAHGGKLGVYAISRGGMETNGTPDYRLMQMVDCGQTGVTVSIPLLEPGDRDKFISLINRVCRNGGIKAQINGRPIKVFDYTNARKLGFCVAGRGYELKESRVYVLYGTVLYPLTTTDQDLMRLVQACGDLLRDTGTLILCAEPNSIGVTPSRESLSYTARTTEYLTRRLTRAYRRILAEQRRQIKPVWAKFVRAKFTPFSGGSLCDAYHKLLNFNPSVADENAFRDTLEDIGRSSSVYCINSLLQNKTREACLVLKAAHPDLRRPLRRMAYIRGERGYRNVFGEHVPAISKLRHDTRLMMRVAAKAGLLRQMYMAHNEGTPGLRLTFNKYCTDALDFVQKVNPTLFVGFSQRDVGAQIKAEGQERVKGWASAEAVVAIILRRNQHKKLEEIRKLAAHYGIKLHECRITKPPKREPKKKEPKFYDLEKYTKTLALGEPTLESAPFFVRSRRSQYEHQLLTPITRAFEFLKRKFGTIAIATDAKDEAALKAQGARDIIEVMMDELKVGIDKREWQFVHATKAGWHFRGSNYYCPSGIMMGAMLASIRVAAEFAPQKMKLTDSLLNAQAVLKTLSEYANWLSNRGSSAKVRENIEVLLNQLTQNAKRNFKGQGYHPDTFDEEWSFLAIFGGCPSIRTEEDAQVFIETVRFLKRRHERQQAREAANTNTETATDSGKEAA